MRKSLVDSNQSSVNEEKEVSVFRFQDLTPDTGNLKPRVVVI